MNLLIPNLPQQLTFSRALTNPDCIFLQNKLSTLSLSQYATVTPKRTVIRMGGGPRTYPGGVSKWQWKRMQAKKAKQLLKARLCRDRQMYEMRKRAELKAAVSELEKPWEVVERAPNLFSVKADEQLKVLADRFQKPGGFDLWSERDGPQLFATPDELPSARFFPKGVVHSIKPYRKIGKDELDDIDKNSESEIEEGIIGEEESNNARGSSISRVRGRSYNEERIDRRELSDVEDGSEEESSSVSRLRGRIYSEERIYRRELSDVEDGLEEESSSPINSVESPIKNGLNGKKTNWRSRKQTGSKFSSQDRHVSNGLYSRDQHSSNGFRDQHGSNGDVGSGGRQGGNNRLYSRDQHGSNGGVGSGRRQGGNNRLYSRDQHGSNGGVGSGRRQGGNNRLYSRDQHGSNGLYSRDQHSSNGFRDQHGSNGDVGSGGRQGGNNRLYSRDQHGSNGGVGSGRRQGGNNRVVHSQRGNYNRGTSRYASQKFKDSISEVYDMSLQQDGRYEFLHKGGHSDSKFRENARLRSRHSG